MVCKVGVQVGVVGLGGWWCIAVVARVEWLLLGELLVYTAKELLLQ